MTDQEKQLEAFHRIDALHSEAFRSCFKGLRFHGWGQTGPDFHAYLHKENRYFADSDYYYRGEREFFHLTSIGNLFSIMNERAFRMYNLDSSDDEEEYGYAGKVLGLSPWQIDHAKRFFFTMSFCPIGDLENRHVWETYGGNFSRAAIIFSVEDDPMAWDNFHMAEVKYASIEPFKEYGERVKGIERGWEGITVRCDLSQLTGFHKAEQWAGEKEVRISTYYPYDNLEAYWKYAKADYRLKEGRNRVTYYIDLPIPVDNESHYIKSFGKPELDRTQILPPGYFDTRPRIKIKKILIGANSGHTIQEYDKLRDVLIETARNRLGYDVEIDYNMFSF